MRRPRSPRGSACHFSASTVSPSCAGNAASPDTTSYQSSGIADGTVSRRAHLEGDRLVASADANLVAPDLQRHPLIADAIVADATDRAARRKSPARRTPTFVSPHPIRALWPMTTKGMPGMVTPGNVQRARDHMHFPPHRRHLDREMRIVGQNRPAGRGARTMDDPAVAHAHARPATATRAPADSRELCHRLSALCPLRPSALSARSEDRQGPIPAKAGTVRAARGPNSSTSVYRRARPCGSRQAATRTAC